MEDTEAEWIKKRSNIFSDNEDSKLVAIIRFCHEKTPHILVSTLKYVITLNLILYEEIFLNFLKVWTK